MKKDKVFILRLDEELDTHIRALAQTAEIPVSVIYREALRKFTEEADSAWDDTSMKTAKNIRAMVGMDMSNYGQK